MTDLQTLVEPLKRELAVPGTFDTSFPDTADADLQASLADGFSEAQMWGFFPTMAVALDATSGDFTVTPDISAAGGSLVLVFSSMRIIRSQLRGMLTTERYKAGSVEAETQRSAAMLTAELGYLKSRADQLILLAQQAARASTHTVTVYDNYMARTGMELARGPMAGFYAYEIQQRNLAQFYAFGVA